MRRWFKKRLPTRSTKMDALQLTITIPCLVAVATSADLRILTDYLIAEWQAHGNLIINDEPVPINWNSLVFMDQFANRLNEEIFRGDD